MRGWILFGVLWGIAGVGLPYAAAAVYHASPSSYSGRVGRLKSGDTLELAAGTYRGLTIKGLHGEPSAWIVIAGPASGPPAVVVGSACCNVVEILNSSFVSIENLTIDSKGIEGTFGVSAKDGLANLTHDIRIQNDRFIGQGATQQTVAISTKTPTWGWIIRNNRISGAGTGIYLGNSDGAMPFVAGLIENNLIENTTGYDMQIKWQRRRPPVPGMPVAPSVTIIRDNAFIKDGRPSPDGDRPNLLVGGFPETGPGAADMYEIYGNLFAFNPREVLLQASGRVSIHDNIFVGGDDAVALQSQDLPLKLAHVYNNTIYTEKRGIVFGTAATVEDVVTGNLIFAATALDGPVKHASKNLTDRLANAGAYVKAPSFDLRTIDLYPLPGKCQGEPLNLEPFARETDYKLDFNHMPKESARQAVVFRGAYAGAGSNPGWQLQAARKNGTNAAARPAAMEISPSTAKRGESGAFLIELRSPKGIDSTGVQWELSVAPGLVINPADIVIGSAAAGADKMLACSPAPRHAGSPPRLLCLVAGGRRRIPDGPVAIVRYRVDRQAHLGTIAVRIEKAIAVTGDLKSAELGGADGFVTVQ